MKTIFFWTGVLISVLAFFASDLLAEPGRIYGRVHTSRGDVLEGIIRWDKNEASWDDIIDGQKERRSYFEKSKRQKDKSDGEFKIFGLTIGGDNIQWSNSAESGIQFGHLEKMTPESDDGAELLLKSGEKVLIENSSTDLGTGIRELIIETKNEGDLELEWDDIEFIEFSEGGDVSSEFGRRLYGTVTTERGGEYIGWICWDMDEMFTDDVIDGQDRDRKREIRFVNIVSIEKISSQAAKVATKDGKVIRLDDSNDIDSGNRGIVVSDMKLGRVTVDWDNFDRLDLKDPPAEAYPRYDDFDGGRKLFGTVTSEDGESYTGEVIWDDDETETWEILNGNYRGVEFDIPFGNVKVIEKISRRTARVTLWDGRSLTLRGSNDVDDDNKGIIVKTKDKSTEAHLDWEAFERVEFSHQ